MKDTVKTGERVLAPEVLSLTSSEIDELFAYMVQRGYINVCDGEET